MKKTLLIAVILSCAVSHAATNQYNVTNYLYDEGFALFYDEAGQAVTNGGVFSLGYYNDGFNVADAVSSTGYDGLISNFQSLASGSFSDSQSPPGSMGLSFSDQGLGESVYNNAVDKTIFLFIGNGTTVADSTQFSLISFTSYLDGSTLAYAPMDNSGPGLTMFDLSLFDKIPGCEPDPNAAPGSDEYQTGYGFLNYANILVGNRFDQGSPYAVQGIRFESSASAIPEPSTLTLGLAALLGLSVRRKRS